MCALCISSLPCLILHRSNFQSHYGVGVKLSSSLKHVSHSFNSLAQPDPVMVWLHKTKLQQLLWLDKWLHKYICLHLQLPTSSEYNLTWILPNFSILFRQGNSRGFLRTSTREGTKVGRTVSGVASLGNSRVPELAIHLCTYLCAPFHCSGVNSLHAHSILVYHEQTRIAATRLLWMAVILHSSETFDLQKILYTPLKCPTIWKWSTSLWLYKYVHK